MLKALFSPREVKFYMDNVHASVTNSMFGFKYIQHHAISNNPIALLKQFTPMNYNDGLRKCSF